MFTCTVIYVYSTLWRSWWEGHKARFDPCLVVLNRQTHKSGSNLRPRFLLEHLVLRLFGAMPLAKPPPTPVRLYGYEETCAKNTHTCPDWTCSLRIGPQSVKQEGFVSDKANWSWDFPWGKRERYRKWHKVCHSPWLTINFVSFQRFSLYNLGLFERCCRENCGSQCIWLGITGVFFWINYSHQNYISMDFVRMLCKRVCWSVMVHSRNQCKLLLS